MHKKIRDIDEKIKQFLLPFCKKGNKIALLHFGTYKIFSCTKPCSNSRIAILKVAYQDSNPQVLYNYVVALIVL